MATRKAKPANMASILSPCYDRFQDFAHHSAIPPIMPHSSDASWHLLPLEMLSPGQAAEIDQVLGDTEQVHRLSELGLRPGTSVEMIQPGSPCIIRLGESRLCFRESELLSILVRVEQM